MCKEMYLYKKKSIAAAKQLGYGNCTVSQLELATTESEIARIMRTARNRLIEKEM